MVACAALVHSAAFLTSAHAQPSSAGKGVKRFDDLRELNNKLQRTISKLDREPKGRLDEAQMARTLKDLEATKLRAVDQLPDVFGLPFGKTFVPLACVDEKIAVGQELLRLLGEGDIQGPAAGPLGTIRAPGKYYVHRLLALSLLPGAKKCTAELEQELGPPVPTGLSTDVRELSNKLERTISKLDRGPKGRLDEAQMARTLKDLEATKLRAVDGFPEILDPPYGTIFRGLSCIDNKLAEGQELLRLLGEGDIQGPAAGPLGTIRAPGKYYVHRLLALSLLPGAKSCKDTLEVELMHSFDLKPDEQSQVGVKETTPNGTDTQNPNKLNAPRPLEHTYKRDGFIGRHERDYVATGVNGGQPESWPPGRNVLFFDVFDLFGSANGAHKAALASEQNLKSTGFSRVSDSSLGSGEAVFQKQPAGSSLLSTIIYVQRGTFILKIAGSCRGCQAGSIESSLEQVAQTQLNQAVINGFPGPSGPSGSGGSGGATGCSGNANLTVTLSGNAAPSGANFDFPSAIPASCNIGIRNNGSGTAARNWSSDVHEASDSSVIYFCHDGPPGTPPGESACPGTQQPSNFVGGSLYQDVFKASDGTWHISVQVFTRQSYNVAVRVHYSWTACTGPSC